jgi:CRP/FNR family transcriptional regulator, cyclic AMP receptor protein
MMEKMVCDSEESSISNAQAFLSSAIALPILNFRTKDVIFSQGEPGGGVMYIQNGHVKLSVVSRSGKEAVVAILEPGDFLGDGALAGKNTRTATATAATPVTVLVISVKEMNRLLHEEHAFSDRFISFMVERNMRLEEDLIDQLFNSSEKRLARTLLLLARYGTQDKPQFILPKISQETLAEMIGTTRSRVNFFMKKFERLGFIHNNGGLHVNDSILSVILDD